MKKPGGKSLFNEKRFKWLRKERMRELRGMTILRAMKIQKELLNFCEPLGKDIIKDSPLSYEILIKRR